jgi:hypothetical protein
MAGSAARRGGRARGWEPRTRRARITGRMDHAARDRAQAAAQERATAPRPGPRYGRGGSCCSAQVLPSGSLKVSRDCNPMVT